MRVTKSQSTRYLTTSEFADLCRVTPETVRYWRHVGRGPQHFKLGRRVLYAAEDVDAWIEAERVRQRVRAS